MASKNLQKSSAIQNNSGVSLNEVKNFVLGDHSDYCLQFFVFEHYKVTTIFANHQIIKHLYFVELTLNTNGCVMNIRNFIYRYIDILILNQ